MKETNPQVDGFIRKNKQWQDELKELRRIVLDSPLVEEVKWRVPCYTLEGKNVAFMGAFKESCAFSFTKGVLLKDPKKILELPGENTQSARVIRFKSVQHILENEPALKALIADAIKVEQSGQKVAFKKATEFAVPEEFQAKLDKLPALKKAFAALTPGRQRAYLLHFSGAKQSATRASRVEKWMPQILKGKGIDDD